MLKIPFLPLLFSMLLATSASAQLQIEYVRLGERVVAIRSNATVNAFSSVGQPTQSTLGNNDIETAEYNRRLQPTVLTAGPGMRLEYTYDTTANNGNVQSQRIQRSGGWSAIQYYNYDNANRLAIAAERPSASAAPSFCTDPGLEWCHQYGYDFFGNRAIAGRLNSVASTNEPTSFNLANNRVGNAGWDFTQDGLLKTTPSPATTFTYDAEGRQVTAGEESYGYDGTGARVWRRLLGGQTRTYVHDGFGRLAVEIGGPASVGRVYLSQDHLGSVRQVPNADGSVRSCRDFEPFGVRVDASGGNRRGTAPCYSAADFGTSLEFTGQERDGETGLDYFGARYMSAAQGRFTSPDVPFADQKPEDPQSWNLYSYVRNNPLSFIDPNGTECRIVKSMPLYGAPFEGGTQFEGDCSSPGDEKVTEGDKAQKFDVRHKEGSTLEYFMAGPVPRYVPNDKPLEPNAQKVLAQVGKTTAPIAILADCAAESYLPFTTAAAGESVWQLGLDTVPKPFAAGGNPYTSQLAIGSRRIFGSKGGGFPSVVRGANGALEISNTNFGGFVGRALGPLGRATGVAGLAIGVYETAACVARN